MCSIEKHSAASYLVDLHSGYLTSRQLEVWHMMQAGLSKSKVARRLKISRQAVYQLAGTIPEKVTAALNDAAKLNGIEPRRIDSNKGVLLGWSRDFKTEAVIALDPQLGLRVWYEHSLGECRICPIRGPCKLFLLRKAEDLGAPLTRQERKLDPSALSSVIFSRVLGTDRASA